MRKITFADRLRYQFDNIMSRGTVALIGWLFVLSAVLILFVSLVLVVLGASPGHENGTPLTFDEILWMNLMHAMDAGALGGSSGSWLFLLLMLITTMGGIFIVSTLIGVLNSGIESKLEELRKGRSFVVEEGHTVIFGWSPLVCPILSELIIANASRPNACIAILANKDKVEMEDEIRDKVGNRGRTRIVCRTGNPVDLTDLEIVNPNGARSIIVLAPEDAESPDTCVIQTILALTNRPNRRPEPYHIVAGIADADNLEIAQIAGGNEARFVLVNDLVSRLTVQTSRQSGLSVVYSELLDFQGNEIYFHQEPSLQGKIFADVLFAYDTAAAIGLRSSTGKVLLNPPGDTVIDPGDAIIVIAEDDSTIKLSNQASYPIEPGAIQAGQKRVVAPERTLILGWNQNALPIITLLDAYAAPGSEVTIVSEMGMDKQEEIEQSQLMDHQHVSFQRGNTTDRRVLDRLKVSEYDHVIVLGSLNGSGPQEADARSLVTLLHLREMKQQAGRQFSIVGEMLDSRNRELAEVTRADDFIVSDRLVSLMLSQISEQGELSTVFNELFSPEGSELYLRPICGYVSVAQPLSFYTLIEAARRRGEVAIGYWRRAEAGDATKSYGVYLNPKKSTPITFLEQDQLIILAEE